MVVMQKFRVNEICPVYNARKYEKQEERGEVGRGEERREKSAFESKRYYTPPGP